MAIRNLRLRDFRNHRRFDMDFSCGIFVLTGRNGVGKTSILESIHVAGTGRSFRSGKNADLIFNGSQSAGISLLSVDAGLENRIDVEIFPQGKKIYQNEKLLRKAGAGVTG
ncbi:MAG: AAA family ATPase, partial [Bdellovibrionales bacterium]|nr:AAA family ATPase [Bdellovibrionales bacterium]